jgi:DNA-directed RNA polymerase subunit RPC12/RpoP
MRGKSQIAPPVQAGRIPLAEIVEDDSALTCPHCEAKLILFKGKAGCKECNKIYDRSAIQKLRDLAQMKAR